jgi:hypothetical protein
LNIADFGQKWSKIGRKRSEFFKNELKQVKNVLQID